MLTDASTLAVCFPDPAGSVANSTLSGMRLTGVDGTERDLPSLLNNADAALVSVSEPVTSRVLQNAHRLRVISTVSSGTDHIDLDCASRLGIAVTRVPDHTAAPTAELAVGLMLAVSRRMFEAQRDLLAGRWQRWELDGWTGTSLHGKTIGIVGFGAIGRRVAQTCLALGMRVLVNTRTPRSLDQDWHYHDLDDLLHESDIVSLHVPLTPDTAGLIGARELEAMRPGAILINCARGPLVDESALLTALDSGRLAGAGLDVFTVEPLPLDAPILTHPRVVALPHIGSATVTARQSMLRDAISNAIAVLEHGWAAPNIVNSDARPTARQP